MMAVRRWIRFGATVLARLVLVFGSIGIIFGCPYLAFRLLVYADWARGFWPGLVAGLLLAFALWWSYLICETPNALSGFSRNVRANRRTDPTADAGRQSRHALRPALHGTIGPNKLKHVAKRHRL